MTLAAKTFKRELAFRASTLAEVKGVLPTGEPVVATVKVDGELEVWDVDVAAGVAQLWNQNERQRVVLPIQRELLDALRRGKHQRARGAGELYAVGKDGKPLPRNEVMSLVKTRTTPTTPADAQHRLRLAVFDLFELDGVTLWRKASYADRFVACEALFGGGTFVRSVAGKTDVRGEDPIRALWQKHVLEENFEGLVLRVNGAVKVKPVHTLDLCVIALQQGSGKNRDTTGALVLAFRDWTGRFLEAGKVGTGLTDAERAWWWQHVKRIPGTYGKGALARRTTFVEPQHVVEVEAESFHLRPVRALRWDAARRTWELQPSTQPGAMPQQPRYVQRRTDKSLDPHDLRLEQVPGWKATSAAVVIPDPATNGTTFGRLVADARPDLARWASKLGIPSEEREDVIQDVTVKALRGWERLVAAKQFAPRAGMPKPGERLIPWLYTITSTTWADRRDLVARRRRKLAELERVGQQKRARAAVRVGALATAARLNPKRKRRRAS